MQKINRFSVYWFDPEPTVGTELRKVRPCVVISPGQMNDVLLTVLVAPLTSTIKPWPFRTTVTISGKDSSVACDQIRAVDRARLKGFISALSAHESEAILQILQQTFAD